MALTRSLALILLASSLAGHAQEAPPASTDGETPADYVARRAAELAADDLYGHLEVADLARSPGQAEAATRHAGIVIGLDEDNELAREILGHTRHKGKWLLPAEAQAEGLKEFDGEWLTQRAYEEHVFRRDWANGWEIDSRKDRVYFKTNTSARKRDRYYQAFLQFRADMERTFGVKLTSKYRVHVYATKEEYHKIGGGPRGTGGFYSPAGRDFHFFDDPDFFQARRIFFHEGTHMFVNLTSPNKDFSYPDWLNEGMAEYFGGARLDYATGAYSFGHILNDRLDVIQGMIRRKQTMPLDQFIAQETLQNAYDQGWSLVLFLQRRDEGKWAPRFGAFLDAIANGKNKMLLDRRGSDTLAAFEKLFLKPGQTLADFETEWMTFVSALKPEPGAPDFRTMSSMIR